MYKFTSFSRLVLVTLMYFFILMYSSSQPLQAQHPVLEQVQKARQKGTVFRPFDLFTYQNSLQDLLPLRSNLPKGAALKINPSTLQRLYQERPSALSLQLPNGENGRTFLVDVVKVDLHTPDFKLSTSSNSPIVYEPGIHYRGVLRDEAQTSVALSFFKDEVIGVIGFAESSNWVLGPLEGAKYRDTYTLYREDDLGLDKSFSCGATEISQEIRKVEEKVGELRTATAIDKTVRVYFECEYDLVLEKGGAVGAANFINGIFNIVSLLYQNEGINIVISEIFTWTTPDTYPITSSSDALVSFRAARPNFNGDIAHLVSRGKPSGGGIAYVPGLCNGYGYAYSYVNSTYSEFPTYSWTVNVITHEMGHNLGSPHTHDCAWNGNNTPLDGCGPAAGYAGSGSCTPLAAPLAPFKGTIMSYCHLLSNIGIDLTQGFGQQPGDKIRSMVASASCLTSSGTTCNAPTSAQLATSNITATTANLSCTLSGVASYDWRYRLVGASAWTDLANTSAANVNLSGLAANSNYEFQVSVQCTTGGAWSAWSASKTFSTLSSTCAAPTSAQLSASNIGASSVTLNCSLSGVASYDWRYRLVGASAWTDLANTSAANVNLSGLAANSNYEFQVSVQCTTGGAWSAWSASKTFRTLTTACNAPSVAQIAASKIGTTTATLNCSLTGVVSYDWRYRIAGNTTWTDLAATSAANVNLSGLTAGRNYEFQVRVQCTTGGTWSVWSSSGSFSTIICNQPSLSQISATVLSSTSVQFSCSIANAQPYSWQYRRRNSGPWISLLNNSTSSITVTGLIPNRVYEYKASVTCAGTATAWSSSATFTTPSSLVSGVAESGLPSTNNDVQLKDLQLYPNPTRNELTVNYQLNADSDGVEIQVFDLTGRKIQQHQFGAQTAGIHQHKIQAMGMIPGLYLLRMQSGDSSLIQRFSVVK